MPYICIRGEGCQSRDPFIQHLDRLLIGPASAPIADVGIKKTTAVIESFKIHTAKKLKLDLSAEIAQNTFSSLFLRIPLQFRGFF